MSMSNIGKLGKPTDTVNASKDRITNLVKFETGRHVRDEARLVSKVYQFQCVLETQLFNDTLARI